MILTFGLAIILENIMLAAWSPDERLITTSYSSKAIFIGEIIIRVSNLLAFLLSVLGIAALYLFLHRTRTGKAVRAAWQDPEGAALQGINLRVSMIAFGLAVASAGAGGVAMAYMYSFNPPLTISGSSSFFWSSLWGASEASSALQSQVSSSVSLPG